MTIAYDLSLSGFPVGVEMIFGEQSAPLGWTKYSDWSNRLMLCLNTEVDGTPLDSGGNTNPQTGIVHDRTSTFTVEPDGAHTHPFTLQIEVEQLHEHTYTNIVNHQHPLTSAGTTLNGSHEHNYRDYQSLSAEHGAGGQWSSKTGTTGDAGGHSHNISGNATNPSGGISTGTTNPSVLAHNHGISNNIVGESDHTHTLSGTLDSHGILYYQEVILCIKD